MTEATPGSVGRKAVLPGATAASNARLSVVTLLRRVLTLAQQPNPRALATGIFWNTGAVGVERLIALTQALYLARLLGIEEFGKYGLVFVTIGLLSSISGLQLGLTASVHVARSRGDDPSYAASVMRLCEVLSLSLAVLGFAAATTAPERVSVWVLGDVRHADIIIPAAVIAGISVVSGVQEGVLQGLEKFRLLAQLRAGTAIASFALILVFAREKDLSSVVTALSAGVILRGVVIAVAKEVSARSQQMVANWNQLWQARGVVMRFSVPAVLTTLISGTTNWFGLYLTAHVPGGFRDVAVLTAAQQWRGLALYVTTISAGVAIPIMSRLGAAGDARGLRQIHRINLVVNVGAASIFIAVLGAASGFVLSLYGTEFAGNRLAFWLLIVTALPGIYVNIMMQYLVSQERMWVVLRYYMLQGVPLAIGYLILVPIGGAVAYAAWTAVMGFFLCLTVTLGMRKTN